MVIYCRRIRGMFLPTDVNKKVDSSRPTFLLSQKTLRISPADCRMLLVMFAKGPTRTKALSPADVFSSSVLSGAVLSEDIIPYVSGVTNVAIVETDKHPNPKYTENQVPPAMAA